MSYDDLYGDEVARNEEAARRRKEQEDYRRQHPVPEEGSEEWWRWHLAGQAMQALLATTAGPLVVSANSAGVRVMLNVDHKPLPIEDVAVDLANHLITRLQASTSRPS